MKKVVYTAVVLIFAIGLGFFLYPYIYNYRFEKKSASEIEKFTEELSEADSDFPYPQLYNALCEYNTELANGGQSKLNSNTAYKKFPVSLTDYGIENGIIGYVTIPAADIKMPLYLGASDTNLKSGAAVMGYTSAPVGGESSNCVIAGHNSWRGAKRFKKIEKLSPGDEVLLTTLWETRKYTVSSADLIYDNDFSSIYIQDGRDMLTFMTCHYKNRVKMRYIVFCEYAG